MPVLEKISYPIRIFCRNYLRGSRFIVLLILLFNNLSSLAQTSGMQEYQLKAVFLLNFTRFVDWPNSAFSSTNSPLVIGILGEDPFGKYLEDAISGETVNGHSVTVQRYNSSEEIKTPHILFLNLPETKTGQQVTEALRGRSILTVSDRPDFLKAGGMIRFFTRDDKIKLEINPEAARAAHLVISSKLLRLAEIFTP